MLGLPGRFQVQFIVKPIQLVKHTCKVLKELSYIEIFIAYIWDTWELENEYYVVINDTDSFQSVFRL